MGRTLEQEKAFAGEIVVLSGGATVETRSEGARKASARRLFYALRNSTTAIDRRSVTEPKYGRNVERRNQQKLQRPILQTGSDPSLKGICFTTPGPVS